MRWRLSSRSALACSRRLCAPMRARATSGCNLAGSPRPIPRSLIGGYPFLDLQHRPNTNVVLRARDAHKLVQAKRAVEDRLERVRGRAIEKRLSITTGKEAKRCPQQ